MGAPPQRLVFVTGKGGVGKTTVAAALGVVAARAGRRVLICELSDPQRLPAAFGVPAGHGAPIELEPGLHQCRVEPREALREWLRDQPGGAAVAALLAGSATFQQFVAAGPGVKELITVGKLADLATGGAYDLVITDAPATGHAVALLTAPRTFAAIAHTGRIGRDAARLWDLLCDPARVAFIGVALPEEMAVRELLELDARLGAELGRRLDLCVVNQLWPERYTDADAVALAAATAGAEAPGRGFVDAALREHHRAGSHRRRIASLRAHLRAPVTSLPELPADPLGPPEFARLAAVAFDQLVPSPLMPTIAATTS
jgi:anion-transporting  ArsA/GET3 family ATPase